MEENNNFLISVYTTNTRETFLVAKSLLDNAGIEYSTKNENLNYSDSFAAPFVLEVTQNNIDEAKELLKDFINGNPEAPANEEDKIVFEQKSEASHAIAIGAILLVILLIILAVVFVK
jgi:hypothetical protein